MTGGMISLVEVQCIRTCLVLPKTAPNEMDTFGRQTLTSQELRILQITH
jgi:hypothetical protein